MPASQITLGFKPFDENRIYWQPQQIAGLVVHPDYRPDRTSDDIAVLRLTPGSTDNIRDRLMWPCVNYSSPAEADPLLVLSFGNIKLDELNPLFVGAFREQTCDNSREACVRSASEGYSECFGDNVSVYY